MKDLFQIISRNNDVNGNPYRLILVYAANTGKVISAFEARSSMPNVTRRMRGDLTELPSFHVSPSEYNETKKALKDILEHKD